MQKSFQTEFMDIYDQFSKSWRDQIDRQHGKSKTKSDNNIKIG